MKITIRECKGNGKEWTYETTKAKNEDVAIRRAIRCHFGRDAFLWQDRGINTGIYGQVMAPQGSGNIAVTGTVKIIVE